MGRATGPSEQSDTERETIRPSRTEGVETGGVRQCNRRRVLKMAGAGLIVSAGIAQPATADASDTGSEADPETGTVTGAVTDTDGDSLEGIEVEIVHPDHDTRATTTTDGGEYTIQIAAGEIYEIAVDESGFVSFSTEVTVEADSVHTVDIELTPRAPLTFADYTNEDGIVEADGIFKAIDDWRAGHIDEDVVFDVIAAWRSGEPVE